MEKPMSSCWKFDRTMYVNALFDKNININIINDCQRLIITKTAYIDISYDTEIEQLAKR